LIAIAAGISATQADESYALRSQIYADYPALATYMNRGLELREKGAFDQARAYYTTAIAQDNKAWPLYLGRASTFEEIRRPDLAIQDYSTVLRLVPGMLMVQVMRGQAYEAMGQYSRALADYDHIIKITPPIAAVQSRFCPQWPRLVEIDMSRSFVSQRNGSDEGRQTGMQLHKLESARLH